MKTFILLFGTVFLFSCTEKKTSKASTDLVNIEASADSSTSHKKSGEAKIQFEKNSHDFGYITQGEIVEYEFIFTNTGDVDLLIASATASCGCTVPDYPKEPINPGKQGKIKVTFNSELRMDKFLKEIYVTANTEPLVATLMITGVIKAKPQLSLPNSH
jgi:Protein of unknown function (DUF1573)